MVLTEQEEKTIKAVVAEIQARKALNDARALVDSEIRATINPLINSIHAAHQEEIATLQANYAAAEQAVLNLSAQEVI